MENPIVKKALPVFGANPGVKLAYFFGSRATGDSGPMSDYDFAVHLEGLTGGR